MSFHVTPENFGYAMFYVENLEVFGKIGITCPHGKLHFVPDLGRFAGYKPHSLWSVFYTDSENNVHQTEYFPHTEDGWRQAQAVMMKRIASGRYAHATNLGPNLELLLTKTI